MCSVGEQQPQIDSDAGAKVPQGVLDPWSLAFEDKELERLIVEKQFWMCLPAARRTNIVSAVITSVSSVAISGTHFLLLLSILCVFSSSQHLFLPYIVRQHGVPYAHTQFLRWSVGNMALCAAALTWDKWFHSTYNHLSTGQHAPLILGISTFGAMVIIFFLHLLLFPPSLRGAILVIIQWLAMSTPSYSHLGHTAEAGLLLPYLPVPALARHLPNSLLCMLMIPRSLHHAGCRFCFRRTISQRGPGLLWRALVSKHVGGITF